MEILQDAAPKAVPDLTVVQGGHQLLVTLAPDCGRVRTGTPLAPGPGGWRIEREKPWAFAATSHVSGERCEAYVSMTLRAGSKMFALDKPRLAITEIDDTGRVKLIPDPDGPIAVLSETDVLLAATAF